MSSGHTGVGTAALACSGTALGGSVVGRAQQLTGLVSGAAFQSPGHMCSFLLCPVQVGSDALQGVLEECVC